MGGDEDAVGDDEDDDGVGDDGDDDDGDDGIPGQVAQWGAGQSDSCL